MRSLKEVIRFRVLSESGRAVGRVVDVLFHPEGRPRVVGFVVERPRLLYLLDRKDRYLALDKASIGAESVTVAGRDAWDLKAARRLGFSWDDTIIWVGMPARTEGGASLGRVRDGLFDPETGDLDAIGLTEGLTADIAVGVRDLPARLVSGFVSGEIVLSDEAARVETTGGAAAAAGKGAAVAKQVGGEATRRAVEAGRTAAAYGAAAARVAAESETGKKASRWLKAIKDELVDAMGDADDE